MNKKRCIIIRSNPLDRDIRSPKEIKALERKYEIVFLGWNRTNKKSSIKSKISYLNYSEILLNVHAPYGKAILRFLPIWWLFIFSWLIINRWDIVHVINLDSLFPAILACKIKRKKIIYEILETYEDSIVLNSNIRDFIMCFDKFLIFFSDAVILADEAQIYEFNGIPNKNIIVIYDSPPDIFHDENFIKNKKEKFTLFYAGVLYKNRHLNLERMIEAVKDIKNVELIIAGYGDMVKEIQGYEAQIPYKLKFIGKISYEDAIRNCYDTDILFQLRDSIVPINKYICGSTLLNAMMSGRPIIVNKGTSTTDKVFRESCGMIVDANDIEEIKNAIIKLRDNPELCKELGKNARRAYEERYSWEIMEQRLLALYQELTGEIGQKDKET